MKIAIVGFGKMGHMIKTIAEKRGNQVVLTADVVAQDADFISSDSKAIAEAVKNSGAEGVIEFSHPSAVMNNISALLPQKIPMVVGTTGWLDKLDSVTEDARKNDCALFYSANFSIGVNIFYKIVEQASKLISAYDDYDAAVWEAHHNTKADSPSGTALEIARCVMKGMPSKTELVNGNFSARPEKHQLQVAATRVGCVPGTHTVFYDSAADTIELTHTARSREGFALGAVCACEWLAKGIQSGELTNGSIYTMSDMLKNL